MNIRHAAFAFTLALCLPTAEAKEGECETGLWARNATNIFTLANPDEFEVQEELTSPDGHWLLRGREQDVVLEHGGNRWKVPGLVFIKPLMEFVWSPDSAQFAINESEGNMAGTWIPHLYTVDEDYGPVRVDLKGSAAVKDAATLPRCTKEEVNLAVVGWVAGRKQAMLVAETPPHAACRSARALRGYRIDARDGKLLDTLPEARVRSEWRKSLGCRLEKAQ